MGGFRSAIKKGGGFLNNVDGELKGYKFTTDFPGNDSNDWVYFVPEILVDGADDPIEQHLFAGGADRYAISKDEQELTMEDGSPVTFGYSTPFGRFMDSLLNAAEKSNVDLESELPNLEDGEALELSTLVGRRFRFKQEVDEKANDKFGKRKGKGKNKGKEYDRTNTVIDAVLGTAAKGSTKPTGGKKAKAKADDLGDEAASVLQDIIASAKVPVTRKSLALPVAKALIKNENKDALKAMILDEEWQESQDWLTIDKKGVLAA